MKLDPVDKPGTMDGQPWASEPVDITIGEAALVQPATVTLPLAKKVPVEDGGYLTVFSRHTPDDPWQNEGGFVSDDGKRITTKARHFSQYGTAAARGLDFGRDGALALKHVWDSVNFHADDPQCNPVSKLWTVRVENQDTVKACGQSGEGDMSVQNSSAR